MDFDYCPKIFEKFDANRDGLNTISDLWILIGDVIALPGFLVVRVLSEIPGMAEFFEIDCSTGRGWFSITLSLVLFWLPNLLGLIAMISSRGK